MFMKFFAISTKKGAENESDPCYIVLS